MFPSEAYEYEEEWCNEPVRDIVLRPQVGASQHPEETRGRTSGEVRVREGVSSQVYARAESGARLHEI